MNGVVSRSLKNAAIGRPADKAHWALAQRSYLSNNGIHIVIIFITEAI